ncbi:hypothetical protein V7794_22565 [Rhizobium laguerreae]
MAAKEDAPKFKMPPECREKMGRVYPSPAEKPRNTQLRWEYVADVKDALTVRCADLADAALAAK